MHKDKDEKSFEIKPEWNSPFAGLTAEDPVYKAAEAIWAVHNAAREEDKVNQSGKGKFSTFSDDLLPIIEGNIQELIRYKDSLLAGLSEQEREMANKHAQLAIGHVEDPELTESLTRIQQDLMDEVEEAKEGKIREIGEDE